MMKENAREESNNMANVKFSYIYIYGIYAPLAISSGHTICSIVVLLPELEFPQVMPKRE